MFQLQICNVYHREVNLVADLIALEVTVRLTYGRSASFKFFFIDFYNDDFI